MNRLDGSICKGHWENGVISGDGVVITKTGKEINGTWNNNKFTKK